MIPENLEDFDEKFVEELIKVEYEEDQRIEYKKVLEGKPEKEYKQKLEHEFCAFANSDGGYIIFGMDDKRNVSGVTISEKEEINLKLSQIISNSKPIIKFTTKILTLRDKQILVVRIYESQDKPVQCSDGSFYIRLNGGIGYLTRDRLQDWFVSKEVKKQRYERLMFEVSLVKQLKKETENMGVSFPHGLYNTRVKEIREAISDYYGYFKEGSQETINQINKTLYEIEKEIRFLGMEMSIEMSRGYGYNPSIISYLDNMKNKFYNTNGNFKNQIFNLDVYLDQLKGFI